MSVYQTTRKTQPCLRFVNWEVFARRLNRELELEAEDIAAGRPGGKDAPLWKRAGIPRPIMWAAKRGWRVPLGTFLTLSYLYFHGVEACVRHKRLDT